MSIKVWHAQNENGANWLIAGCATRGTAWEKELIPEAGSAEFLNLPETIKRILQLDKPDLLVTVNVGGLDQPAVSIELTTTTPQGQHPKQRVPRIVAAAEAGIPALYIILGRKVSRVRGRRHFYHLGCDIRFVMDRITEINQVPALIYEWPDKDGDVLYDPKYPGQPPLASASMLSAFKTVDRMIRCALRSVKPMGDAWIKSEIDAQRKLIGDCDIKIGNYDTLTLVDTDKLEEFLAASTKMPRARVRKTLNALPHRIHLRSRSLVFRPAGRLFDHAGDPYVGMLAFFDYAFCRTGPTHEDRELNLIHMPVKSGIARLTDEFAPSGYHAYWKDKCAFRTKGVPSIEEQFRISHHLQYGCVFTKIKPLRIIGAFADIIVFQDALLPF